MAEFVDPTTQANLERMMASLRAKQAELEQDLATAQQATRQYLSTIHEADTVAARQAETARPPGEGSIRGAARAAEEHARAEDQVNKSIARQIELQAQALREARLGASQARGAVPTTAAGRAAASAEQAVRGYPSAADVEAAARDLRRAQAPPPRDPIPPSLATAAGGLPPGGARATKELTDNERALVKSAREAAGGESQIGAAVQRNVLTYTQADNALARHGALTTEFIQAAARGQVTMREFGNQIGATIGKFAGWTGAAAAVYGVIAAVTELGKGAIDSSNTVGKLHRTIEGLDNRQASSALIQLSRDTNVGMKEAGDAVFQFSRTFPNLADSTTVAKLALQAFQLDGVKVGDTVKAVTAIHQQFKISAQEMRPIFDELGAGQRDFNARITDQVPLLQKSMSAIKNAGGDLHDYIAITTTALRTTQLSGSQLGTAFSRSAANFLNPGTAQGQKDRGVLQALGIDPNQKYTDVILDAIKKSSTLTDGQRAELSRAIFGPLRGGLAAGLFTGGPAILEEVQKKLSPEKSKGTFQDEFDKEMQTARQSIKRLGVDLQQLGAELGRSGLLSGLGLMVHALDSGLQLATQLAKAFSALPGPLREAAGVLASVAVVRGVGSRFNLPLIGPSAEKREQTQIRTGLEAEGDYYLQQSAAKSRQAAAAGQAAVAAEVARNEALATGDEKAIAAAQQRFLAAQEKLAQLETESAINREAAVVTQEQLTAIDAKVAAGMKVQQAAAEVGLSYQLATLSRGVATREPVSKIGAGGGQAAESGIILPAAQTRAAESGIIVPSAAAAERAGAEATKTAERVSLATRATSAVSTGIGALGTAVGKFTPWLLGLGLAAGAVTEQVNQMHAAQETVDKDLNATPANLDAARGQAEQSAKDIGKTRTSVLNYIPIVGGALNRLANLGEDVFKGINNSNFNNLAWSQNVAKQLLAPVKTEQFTLPQMDPNARSTVTQARGGGAFSLLIAQAQDDQKTVKNTNQGRKDWYDELRQLARQIDAEARLAEQGLSAKDKKPIEQARLAAQNQLQQVYSQQQDRFKITNIDANDPFAQFRTKGDDQNVKDLQALADRAKLFGSRGNELQQMAYAYTYLTQKFAHSTDDKDLQLLSQAQGYFVEAVRKQVQDLLNQAQVTQDPKQKQQLLNQARQLIRTTESNLHKSEGAVDPKLRGIVNDAYKQVFAQFDGLTKQIDTTAKTDAQQAAFEKARLRTELAKAQNADDPVKQAQEDQAFARKELAQAHNEKERLQAQIDLANADNAYRKALEERTQAVFNYQEALAGYDPVRVASIKIDAAAADLRSKVPGTKGFYDALAKHVQAQQDYAKQVEDVAQARFTLRAAQTEDPVLKAQIDLQGATQQVAYEAGHGGTNTKAYLDAAAKQAQQQQALAKAIEDRAQAQFVYRASLTQDPVKKAAIDLQAATQKLAYDAQHGGTGTATYLQDAAKANDARQKLVDAHIQDREDTIQFKLSLSKISTETAIQEYQALLNVHNLTRAKRREILTKINDLQKGSQSEFGALDLGTIRLPTPYEIRRAVAAAKEGASITQHYSTNIQVTDTRSATQVGVQMDRYHRGTSKAIARALGAR